ncbi:ABC transporter substrate-binding protein [Pollutimonas bauzanensis]|uniref:ABC-type Fe3+ transport system, substrate-binding protein n=1 Tax=Pollutimonas bauzanensis TaxID=658167 RepID=A0A1M5YRM6_9BURK|nr:extracellular solute-binding protein [Pollutimonas bauzanensis]SHI14510.1 ABC-type Fe3+ transport system, substrate-binding protein [Pollutimonas bauzanensis]
MNKKLKPLLSALLLAAGAPALAGTVTVITSFPKELTQAYKSAFEQAHPDIKLEILNKNTVSGIAYVRETEAGKRPEVFWASAPDAFEVLAQAKLLEKAGDIANPDVPDKIGNFPINDPGGMFMGQALAGYGIMYNTRLIKAKKLAAPASWTDLLKPEWYGNVGITSPSRSGTMHLTVETILQGEGWDQGWNTLLRMAGNSAAVTDRSFGVPDGVNNGQFGAGPVIDFFGLSSKYSKFPVEFVYPEETAIVPANIALIAGAKNTEEGKKFIAYTLSKEGQELLLRPEISRLPVLPYKNLSNVPQGYPDPDEIAKRSKVQFDVDLSQSRYYIVQSLFDQTITFRFADLQQATKAIHDAQAKLGAQPGAKAGELLAEARKLAWTPLLDVKQAQSPELLAIFKGNKKDADISQKLSRLQGDWNSQAKANYEKAQALAKEAASL